ncbi:MAG TPA: hypothetical protein VNE39_18685 [Planctomycetota bacterium]|nr:hypothetical protein [Planctomycetota bacterium]
MDASDHRELDELLRRAAPRGVPDGFAGRVLASARARQRRGRLVRWAVAAAAVLAVGVAVRLWLDSQVGTLRGLVARAEFVAPPKREAVERTPSASFAAVLPSTGDATHSVMIARFNGKLVVCARPKATEADEFWPTPRSMVGWVSVD